MRELHLKTDKPYTPTEGGTIHYGTGKNSIDVTELKICRDARKDACPYAIDVLIDTPEVNFYQTLCAAQFNKDLCNGKGKC